MGEQQSFAELLFVALDNRINRNAGKLAQIGPHIRVKGQRDKGGPGRNDVDAKLSGNLIAKAGCADFGNGKAATGHDKGLAGPLRAGACGDIEPGIIAADDVADFGVQAQLDMGGITFIEQHVDDLERGFIAEKLAQCFFMPGNVMAIDQIDEVKLGVTFECRDAETLVLRNEIFRAGMQIGEVAATAPGNPDFFSRFRRMIDNHNRTAAFSGFDCTHKAGGTGTNHKDINLLHAAGQSFGENDLPYTDKLVFCQCLSGVTLLFGLGRCDIGCLGRRMGICNLAFGCNPIAAFGLGQIKRLIGAFDKAAKRLAIGKGADPD